MSVSSFSQVILMYSLSQELLAYYWLRVWILKSYISEFVSWLIHLTVHPEQVI